MGSETTKSRTKVSAFRRHGRRLVPLFFLLLSPIACSDSHGAPYLRLQSALEMYLQIAQSGGWPTVADGPTIEPDSRDPRVVTLARRLMVTGDLEDSQRTFTVYDDVSFCDA